jgi:hypothetical protein
LRHFSEFRTGGERSDQRHERLRSHHSRQPSHAINLKLYMTGAIVAVDGGHLVSSL